MRLTGTSYAVLSLVQLLGSATPYDLKQALETSIENFWPVPHTTAYTEPDRLAREGLLSVQQEPGGRRRKLYSLTERGRQELRAWTSSAEVPPPQLREEGVLKIFAGADPVPILRRRWEWHSAKLSELEGFLGAIGEREAVSGVRASLMVGIGYERLMVDALSRFLAEQDGEDAQAATDSS